MSDGRVFGFQIQPLARRAVLQLSVASITSKKLLSFSV